MNTPPGQPPRRGARLLHLLLLPAAPVYVLTLVLLLTAVLAAVVARLVHEQQQTRFEREVVAYERELNQRLASISDALNATRSMWQASGPVSRPTFEAFVAGLNLPQRYPGLSSVGYAPLVPAEQKDAFVRRQQASDPAHPLQLHPASIQPYVVPVVYITPSVNAATRGYDMYSEPVRRAALEQARITRQLRASGRVTLMNMAAGEQDRRGLLLYLPIVDRGTVSGYIYAPLQLTHLLPTIIGRGGTTPLSLHVQANGQNLYGEPLPNAPFRLTDQLTFAGQVWDLTLSAPAGFGRDEAANTPWLVLLAGFTVALLAAMANQSQVRARQQAEEVNGRLVASRAELERSRAEFEAVFRSMQDTAVFADPSGQVLFANDALERSFGLRPHEIRGAPLAGLHGDDALLAQLDRQPGPHTVTTLFRRRGGQTFYGEMQRNPVLSERGDLLGQLEVIRDISERRRSAQALRDSEQRYRGVLESMPQIVWLTDAQGVITLLNQRWADYVGGEGSGEQRTRSLAPYVHPADRERFQDTWRTAVQSETPFELEHRLRSASGDYRTFVSRGLPVRGTQGRVLEWVGTSTDIDDQVYSEMASRLLADLGQALSVRLTDEADLRRVLTLLTSTYADAAALWLAENMHEPVVQVRDAQLLERVPALSRIGPFVQQQLGTGTVQRFRREQMEPLGLLSGLLLPLTLQGGDSLGVLALGFQHAERARDLEVGQELASRLVTALENRRLYASAEQARASVQELNATLEERVRQRTDELSSRSAELGAANRELEAFSYSVSHDLRTPLRHITGFADLLRKESEQPGGAGLSAKAQRYLNIINESAARMNVLIDDLLEFSRTSRAEMRQVPVELDSVVAMVVRELAPDQQDRKVEWHIGPLPTVMGDPALIRQVYSNLLSNALKYTRPRERAVIEVGAHTESGETIVSIRDNGVGFDPQYVDKLFGVFQRLHRADEFEGTGIGLANVRRIVARHGGRVWAESDLPDGPGARFSVVLPLAQVMA
ncbi:CHASE domain-containing protein [Deinococcus sonorensis]|uniref:histidine kinase n=2 Tax=Deinococcus sonorensis TaxID=309891 RepID=A0AAU7UAF9_9DEIO